MEIAAVVKQAAYDGRRGPRSGFARSTTWVRLAVVAALLGPAAGALAAAKRNPVEKLASEATAAYKSGDYEGAVDRLERAYSLEPAPTLVYNIAKAYEKWGHGEEARAQYERFLSLPDGDPKLRGQAEAHLKALDAAARKQAARAAAAKPQPPSPASASRVVLPNNPKAGAFLFHLGKAYERLGQKDKAVDHFTRYLAGSDVDPKMKAEAEERLKALGPATP